MSYLSETSYNDFLNERIACLEDKTVRKHVKEKFDLWYQQYRAARLVERACELLMAEQDRPHMLFLHREVDLQLMEFLANEYSFESKLFRGFLVHDSLWSSIQPEWFAPFKVARLSDWKDGERASIISLSDEASLRDNGRDHGNDYMKRFIDMSRLARFEEIRRNSTGRPIVLYVDYRKVKSFEAIAEAISDRYVTIGLVTDSKSANSGYEHLICEPNLYLWPLVFKHLAPDVFHVNVGWSTQGLPFMALVPDTGKAVADFYDILAFTPDDHLDVHHSEPCRITRASENFLWTQCNHFVHRNGGPVTTDLEKKFPGKDIVPIIEYVKEPVYSQTRPVTEDLRLVYGGIIIQDAAEVNSLYYSRFRAMVESFARDNLHLYIYPSPYLYGFKRPKAVEELIKAQGLTNAYACEPLEDDEWVREIAKHDYGIFIFGDTRPAQYPYILPFKFLSYLRAGLPIIVPEDQTFMADLVRDNNIGVVYRYEERLSIPEILADQDLNTLKENVVRFRSSMSINKAGQKAADMYDRILKDTMTSRKTSAQIETPLVTPTTPPRPANSSARGVLSLDDREFISEKEYIAYLETAIAQADPEMDKEFVRARLGLWSQQYRIERMRQRGEALLAEFQDKSFAIYLDGEESLHAAALILNSPAGEHFTGFKGFVIDDAFLATQDVKMFAPYSVLPQSRAEEIDAVIFSLSGPVPGAGPERYLASDFREKFIDVSRFDSIREIRRGVDGQNVILYPLYREIHTVAIMAKQVKQAEPRLYSFVLSPKALIHEDFDTVLIEPFFYLWPLLFQVIHPDLVHMNVGWGIQALALSPFVPDKSRTVIDFYEVLSFLPDIYFAKTHSTPEQVRTAEKHFITNYDHIIHLCSEDITTKLQEKYPHSGSIISVTEYLQEPTYSVQEKKDDLIRIVYGGNMLATTDPNDQHYRAFVKVAPYYAKRNLHLYIYNSPYVHGMGQNDALKQVIEQLGLSDHIHACKPLELEEFVRVISEYDFGSMFVRPKDMDGMEYNYFMAYKFLTYLRAGLPMLIDSDNHFMASLVNRYQVGIVLQEYDLDHIADIVNNADLVALKRNVVKFRDVFSVEKGAAKVLDMYHQILDQADQRCAFPTATPTISTPLVSEARKVDLPVDFGEMIETMARAENRLYYRDQSPQTLSSLVSLTRRCDPTVIVELGTLAGLSLRAWIAATEQTKITAVDMSFQKLMETMDLIPLDLSHVTLREQDILQTDFTSMWTLMDRVILFVDAHDLPNVPIMDYVLTTALPMLPDGSIVVVDDLWYSPERLTPENAWSFLEDRVRGEIDELQCFNAHYAPYHGDGSFMGFAEVIPLMKFVNKHRIELEFDEAGKHVAFTWKQEYLQHHQRGVGLDSNTLTMEWGSTQYNPLESVPTGPKVAQAMRCITEDYRLGNVGDVANRLSEMLQQHPHDQGLSYGLAVCLARAGMLSEARDVLGRYQESFNHPRCRQLFEDLVQRVEPDPLPSDVKSEPEPVDCGITLFAMPKPFTGHNGVIQRNAIRSWARLEPKPEIILFGDEPGTKEMAEEVGAKHICQVKRNEFGTPLVNELFYTCQENTTHDIMAYVNADIILLQDFIEGVQRVNSELPEFLIVGQRWDLVFLKEIDYSDSNWQSDLLEEMREQGMLHAECGLDYFVFHKNMYREIPPFAIGRTAWDNWLVMAPNKAGVPVVDGTHFITAIHQEHDYGHVAGGRQEAWTGIEAARNRSLVGGATDDSGRTSGAPWVLREDGTMAKVQPRSSRYLTAAYKDERSIWLLEQADALIAIQRWQLAACKCEEALAFLESLLVLEQTEHHRSLGMNPRDLSKRCVITSTKLARCYMQIGRLEQVIATYGWLLDNPSIEMPQAQRNNISQIRDEVNALGCRIESTKSASKSMPALQANVSDMEELDPYHQTLFELERKHREMPEGTRAKYTMAMRLSDLFRRAGLTQKSLAIEAEAMMSTPIIDSQTEPASPVRPSQPRDNGRPKVTVITACYNAQQYLSECLDSIINQTMSEWELLLLDDGSTDETRAMIESYTRRDPRIKMYCFEENAGPYVRRNFAIQKARTPFIVIQDADDIMCPEKLERLYAAISEDERLGLVGSFYHLFLDEFKRVEHAEYVSLATTHEQIISRYCQYGILDFAWHGSAIIRKHLFEDIGYYDENPFGSDSFMLARVVEYACRCDTLRLKNIPESLTLRRKHAKSQTGILPTFDPRSRRCRFAKHRREKLAEAIQKLDTDPNADVRVELRESACNDFVAMYGHLFKIWEREPLTEDIVNEFIDRIFSEFSQGQFVQCIATCGIVDRLVEQMSGMTPCYNLVRGLAFFGIGLYDESRMYLQREYEMHQTVVAQDFCCRYLTEQDDQRTATERTGIIRRAIFCGGQQPSSSVASKLRLDSLGDDRKQTTVALSIVVECLDVPTRLENCLKGFREQTTQDFELIVLVPSGCTSQTQTDFSTEGLDLLLLSCPEKMGQVRRRNAAAIHARGQYLAFLGEGMTPATNFVERVLSVFAQNEIDGLRGKIAVITDKVPPAHYDLGQVSFYATCDTDEMCVFRKETFDRLGGFPRTSFDQGAFALSYLIYSNSDDAVHPILYHPDIVVYCDNNHISDMRFTMMDYLCIEQLSRSGQVSKQKEMKTSAFLRFVTSLYLSKYRYDGDEELRCSLSNGILFFDRFPFIAIQWAQKALACRPGSVWANYFIGAALVNIEQLDDAIPFLEQSLPSLERQVHSGRIDYYQSEYLDYPSVKLCFEANCRLLARCYIKTKQYQRAVDICDRLLYNPRVELSGTQREELTRIRDRLAQSLREVTKNSTVEPSSEVSPIQDQGSQSPKLSIVTACHNCERFLPECLDSIRDQGFEAWELFLLDDGSSDGTRRIIEEYASRDDRIIPFYFDQSKGPYVRRNLAIQQAKSDFIVIHDADDIMAQTKLDLLYCAISRNDRLAMVGSCYRTFLDNIQMLEYADVVTPPLDHDSIAHAATSWQHGISHGTAVIRKSIFECIGLYDENPFAADSFWSAKLAEYARHYPDAQFKNLPQCLTYCRVHDASQTQRLPMWDPRSRRARYHRYCQIKLKHLCERFKSLPGLDIAAELRQCDCADFLTRFKAHIIKWEAEEPDQKVVSELLEIALGLFKEGHYVSCISTLNGLETMDPPIAKHVRGFDLLQGAAFYAIEKMEKSRDYLEREIRNHDNPAARQLIANGFDREEALNVLVWWWDNTKHYNLSPTLLPERSSSVEAAMSGPGKVRSFSSNVR